MSKLSTKALPLIFLGTLLLPWTVTAGSLRVGPTRIDLSAQHPVAVVEVQNTGDSQTLTQLDTFAWTQDGRTDVLEATTELIATPLVMRLAPGETHIVRVGLREPNRTSIERSYRLFVREVTPTFSAQTGLQFAVRISVPVFAMPANAQPGITKVATDIAWHWTPDMQDCSTVRLANPSGQHERVMRAELLGSDGTVLWQASQPTYVLAQAQRTLLPPVCPPVLGRISALRLITDSRTMTLAGGAPSLVVDAKVH